MPSGGSHRTEGGEGVPLPPSASTFPPTPAMPPSSASGDAVERLRQRTPQEVEEDVKYLQTNGVCTRVEQLIQHLLQNKPDDPKKAAGDFCAGERTVTASSGKSSTASPPSTRLPIVGPTLTTVSDTTPAQSQAPTKAQPHAEGDLPAGPGGSQVLQQRKRSSGAGSVHQELPTVVSTVTPPPSGGPSQTPSRMDHASPTSEASAQGGDTRGGGDCSAQEPPILSSGNLQGPLGIVGILRWPAQQPAIDSHPPSQASEFSSAFAEDPSCALSNPSVPFDKDSSCDQSRQPALTPHITSWSSPFAPSIISSRQSGGGTQPKSDAGDAPVRGDQNGSSAQVSVPSGSHRGSVHSRSRKSRTSSTRTSTGNEQRDGSPVSIGMDDEVLQMPTLRQQPGDAPNDASHAEQECVPQLGSLGVSQTAMLSVAHVPPHLPPQVASVLQHDSIPPNFSISGYFHGASCHSVSQLPFTLKQKNEFGLDRDESCRSDISMLSTTSIDMQEFLQDFRMAKIDVVGSDTRDVTRDQLADIFDRLNMHMPDPRLITELFEELSCGRGSTESRCDPGPGDANWRFACDDGSRGSQEVVNNYPANRPKDAHMRLPKGYNSQRSDSDTPAHVRAGSSLTGNCSSDTGTEPYREQRSSHRNSTGSRSNFSFSSGSMVRMAGSSSAPGRQYRTLNSAAKDHTPRSSFNSLSLSFDCRGGVEVGPRDKLGVGLPKRLPPLDDPSSRSTTLPFITPPEVATRQGGTHRASFSTAQNTGGSAVIAAVAPSGRPTAGSSRRLSNEDSVRKDPVGEEAREPTVSFDAFLARMAYKINGRYPPDLVRSTFYSLLVSSGFAEGNSVNGGSSRVEARAPGPAPLPLQLSSEGGAMGGHAIPRHAVAAEPEQPQLKPLQQVRDTSLVYYGKFAHNSSSHPAQEGGSYSIDAHGAIAGPGLLSFSVEPAPHSVSGSPQAVSTEEGNNSSRVSHMHSAAEPAIALAPSSQVTSSVAERPGNSTVDGIASGNASGTRSGEEVANSNHNDIVTAFADCNEGDPDVAGSSICLPQATAMIQSLSGRPPLPKAAVSGEPQSIRSTSPAAVGQPVVCRRSPHSSMQVQPPMATATSTLMSSVAYSLGSTMGASGVDHLTREVTPIAEFLHANVTLLPGVPRSVCAEEGLRRGLGLNVTDEELTSILSLLGLPTVGDTELYVNDFLSIVAMLTGPPGGCRGSNVSYLRRDESSHTNTPGGTVTLSGVSSVTMSPATGTPIPFRRDLQLRMALTNLKDSM